jgi:Fur family ferric uptake transcriptional regulator
MRNSTIESTRQALPGLRITNQRALILELLRQGNGHMDADEVYRLARKRQPRISLSTVYRNLQTLKSMGLVDEVHFDDDHHHYEVRRPKDGAVSEHHHLICQNCGKIIEFRLPLAKMVQETVPEAKGFKITGTETRVLGYCDECRAKGQ